MEIFLPYNIREGYKHLNYKRHFFRICSLNKIFDSIYMSIFKLLCNGRNKLLNKQTKLLIANKKK